MTRNPTHAFAAFGAEPEKNWGSQFDLANWGIENVAYVKPIAVGGEGSYGIFAADGTELAQMDNRDEAIVTIRQNDLEALSVH
jgi:hypothetical protein